MSAIVIHSPPKQQRNGEIVWNITVVPFLFAPSVRNTNIQQVVLKTHAADMQRFE